LAELSLRACGGRVNQRQQQQRQLQKQPRPLEIQMQVLQGLAAVGWLQLLGRKRKPR
jgi:hypothetical protein